VCEPYAPDEHTLLLLHFDGYYAGAQDEPGTAEGTSFAEGRFGQGVLIDNADKLSYPAEGNLRPEAGAIEFWVRPNFDAHSGRVHTFFETEDPKSSGGIQIAMDGDLGFLFWTAEGSTGISANVLDWQAGDWHHVATTWQGYDMALFVDGRRVASSNAANPPAVLGDAFRVGSTPNLGWQADAVIDELRISDIPRLGKGDACGRSW